MAVPSVPTNGTPSYRRSATARCPTVLAADLQEHNSTPTTLDDRYHILSVLGALCLDKPSQSDAQACSYRCGGARTATPFGDRIPSNGGVLVESAVVSVATTGTSTGRISPTATWMLDLTIAHSATTGYGGRVCTRPRTLGWLWTSYDRPTSWPRRDPPGTRWRTDGVGYRLDGIGFAAWRDNATGSASG